MLPGQRRSRLTMDEPLSAPDQRLVGEAVWEGRRVADPRLRPAACAAARRQLRTMTWVISATLVLGTAGALGLVAVDDGLTPLAFAIVPAAAIPVGVMLWWQLARVPHRAKRLNCDGS